MEPVVTGSGESEIDTPRSAGLLTSVSSVAELLAGVGSVCAPVTLAEFVIIPGDAGAVTAMSTVTESLNAIDPRLQVRTPLLGAPQVPWLGVAETKLAVPGSVNDRLLSSAGRLPVGRRT